MSQLCCACVFLSLFVTKLDGILCSSAFDYWNSWNPEDFQVTRCPGNCGIKQVTKHTELNLLSAERERRVSPVRV